MSLRKNFRAGQLRRTTLALSLGMGLGLVSMGTMAQSSTGSVFGRAAPGANTTVVIHNVNTGQELTMPWIAPVVTALPHCRLAPIP